MQHRVCAYAEAFAAADAVAAHKSVLQQLIYHVVAEYGARKPASVYNASSCGVWAHTTTLHHLLYA